MVVSRGVSVRESSKDFPNGLLESWLLVEFRLVPVCTIIQASRRRRCKSSQVAQG